MGFNMHKKKGFTFAETLVTVAIIAVVSVVIIGVIHSQKTQQRELLSRFQVAFEKLDSIIGLATTTSKNQIEWESDKNSLANLTCRNGSTPTECLQTVLYSVSTNPKSCPETKNCFSGYDKLVVELKKIFSSLTASELKAFTLSGGVSVLSGYLDSSCTMEIPISQKGETIETVKGCGFFLVDVNGKKKPNNMLINENKKIVDRFLIAITPNGLIKSNLLETLASCPTGKTYDATRKTCVVNDFTCPIDMTQMAQILHENVDGSIVKSYPFGTDHADCFTLTCKSGDIPTLGKTCPESCPKEDEVKKGGLWVYEGGSLSREDEKDCCIPIYNQKDLSNIKKGLDRNYCLMTDITLVETGEGYDGGSWTPIAPDSEAPFSGNFYGNGHRIINLTINRTDLTSLSLFGYISGSIENLELVNAQITNVNPTGENNIMPLCEWGTSVSNIVSESYLKCASCFRAMGITSNNKVTNAISKGTLEIQNSNNSGYIGGVSMLDGDINQKNLINNMNITTTNDLVGSTISGVAGGMYGVVENSINNGTIEINIPNTASISSLYVFGIGRPNKLSNAINNGQIIINNQTSATDINLYGVGNATNSMNNGNLTINGNGNIYPTTGTNYINTGKIDSNNKLLISATSNIFYLSSAVDVCTSSSSCVALTEESSKLASTFASILDDTDNSKYWSIVDGFEPTLKAAEMPPQTFRDCRNNATPYGGCFDVMNTPNTFIPADTTDPDYMMWAWKVPSPGAKLEDPVLRWQCKPYRSDGFDCCIPSYVTGSWETKLEKCPIGISTRGEN